MTVCSLFEKFTEQDPDGYAETILKTASKLQWAYLVSQWSKIGGTSKMFQQRSDQLYQAWCSKPTLERSKLISVLVSWKHLQRTELRAVVTDAHEAYLTWLATEAKAAYWRRADIFLLYRGMCRGIGVGNRQGWYSSTELDNWASWIVRPRLQTTVWGDSHDRHLEERGGLPARITELAGWEILGASMERHIRDNNCDKINELFPIYMQYGNFDPRPVLQTGLLSLENCLLVLENTVWGPSVAHGFVGTDLGTAGRLAGLMHDRVRQPKADGDKLQTVSEVAAEDVGRFYREVTVMLDLDVNEKLCIDTRWECVGDGTERDDLLVGSERRGGHWLLRDAGGPSEEAAHMIQGHTYGV